MTSALDRDTNISNVFFVKLVSPNECTGCVVTPGIPAADVQSDKQASLRTLILTDVVGVLYKHRKSFHQDLKRKKKNRKEKKNKKEK